VSHFPNESRDVFESVFHVCMFIPMERFLSSCNGFGFCAEQEHPIH
jgi:hypothetical protein